LPFPVPVVVLPPRPAPPVVEELVPELVGEVAVVEVLELEVLVDVDVWLVLELDELVGVDAVDEVCWWHSLMASRAIVLAPWARFLRSVGLTVTGRPCTSRFSEALAFRAAPQLPEVTADEIWSAWPLSLID
jgi:hypothetical protein